MKEHAYKRIESEFGDCFDEGKMTTSSSGHYREYFYPKRKFQTLYSYYDLRKGSWLNVLEKNIEVDFLEQEFQSLSSKWKAETGVYSITFQKINDTYLDIIAMGPKVLPLILKDMTSPNGSAHWHSALKAITRINPVKDDELSKPKKIKEAWVKWGKENGII